MTQTPFQRALDALEDRIFRLPAPRRQQCLDGTLAHLQRVLPADSVRTTREEQRTLAYDGRTYHHPALVAFANQAPTLRDRCVVSVAQAHGQHLWWLPLLLLRNSLTSGVDVAEYALSWWLMQARWCPRVVLRWALVLAALVCADVRRAQTQASRVPAWLLAWQRMPVAVVRVCAWRVGFLTGWRWARRDAGEPDAPDLSFLPAALRAGLAALTVAALLWPDDVRAGVLTAALSSAMVWEVRTTGSDTNGGGFKSGATGTDYSQQASAQFALTTASTVNATTTLIDVAVADATVTATWVGNVLQITGGTATAGAYEITAVDTVNNRITVDRSAGTSGQTVAGSVGGALASPGQASNYAIASNTVWLQSGTYTIASTTANVSTGVVNRTLASQRWEGYETTRADLGTQPILQAAASGVTSVTLFNHSGNPGLVRNLSFDGQSKSSIRGAQFSSFAGIQYRLSASNCTNYGFASSQIVRGYLTGTSSTGGWVDAARALGCEANGVSMHFSNTGAFLLSYQPSVACLTCAANHAVVNAVAYGCTTSHGVSIGGSGAMVVNVLSEGNALYGFSGGGVARALTMLLNCGGYNNTSGNIETTALTLPTIGFLGGTASFFVDPANGDFRLNSTVGGGALARAAGYPGAFPRGTTTGSLDVGAVQSAPLVLVDD